MNARTDRIALMFPGQGAQYPGMGLPWLDTPQWQLVDALSHRVGRDVGALLIDADTERLRRTDNAQLALFALETMLLQAVRAAVPGLPVVACAGHGVGEYAALAAAGVLKPADAAQLVAERGAAMADAARAAEGAMAVLTGGDPQAAGRLTERLRGAGARVWLAHLDGPDRVVVSGTRAGVEALVEQAPEAGFRAVPHPSGGAFHSPLMIPAQYRLSAALVRAPLRAARFPVVATADGRVRDGDPAEWRALMIRHLVEPVRWDSTVRTLVGPDSAAAELIELGPGTTLADLARHITPDTPATTVTTPAQVAALAARYAAERV
ncbi:ACP S-malonyltransferase [Kitasatospora terrestris]|uniref:[acyl-carrier-protein] S-malonyltransferase n=1 Tax=Kitasatospora terrestris TaxID=258051 RepID=A0ABP9DTD5_9ACTN